MEKKYVEAITHNGHVARKILKSLELFNRFDIGCFMLKKETVWTNNVKHWATETFGKNSTSRKYKVVAVDEFGIPFFQRVQFDGKLQKEIKYMANIDINHSTFVPDPDMECFILLGGDMENFDPMESYKEVKRLK